MGRQGSILRTLSHSSRLRDHIVVHRKRPPIREQSSPPQGGVQAIDICPRGRTRIRTSNRGRVAVNLPSRRQAGSPEGALDGVPPYLDITIRFTTLYA
jgi:hypothetical protein